MASKPSSPTTPGQMPMDMMANATEAAERFSEQFSKLFSQMKMPNLPAIDEVMQAQRRNMEALSAANRVAMEGAQAIGRRNMEIMQQSLAEMSETLTALTTSENPQLRAARQADLVKNAYTRAVANLHEMSDLIQRANGEAIEVLNKRVVEALDEIKVLIEKTQAGK